MPTQPLLDKPTSVPQAIVRVLEQAGIEFVFGMPGGRTGAIFDALYDHRSSIRAVLVREEGLAVAMADVYGRLTGRPGVAMGQGAFLLTNAGMATVEAFLAGSPMLLLSDLSDGSPYSHHGPYQAGTGDYGTWDASGTIGGYTKQVFVAREPAQAVQQTQLAIKHALAGQPGPVAVLFHSAALAATVGPDTAPRRPRHMHARLHTRTRDRALTLWFPRSFPGGPASCRTALACADPNAKEPTSRIGRVLISTT